MLWRQVIVCFDDLHERHGHAANSMLWLQLVFPLATRKPWSLKMLEANLKSQHTPSGVAKEHSAQEPKKECKRRKQYLMKVCLHELKDNIDVLELSGTGR